MFAKMLKIKYYNCRKLNNVINERDRGAVFKSIAIKISTMR